MEVSAKV